MRRGGGGDVKAGRGLGGERCAHSRVKTTTPEWRRAGLRGRCRPGGHGPAGDVYHCHGAVRCVALPRRCLDAASTLPRRCLGAASSLVACDTEAASSHCPWRPSEPVRVYGPVPRRRRRESKPAQAAQQARASSPRPSRLSRVPGGPPPLIRGATQVTVHRVALSGRRGAGLMVARVSCVDGG
jgi:hypothetical protein